jgi:hypothetical protein
MSVTPPAASRSGTPVTAHEFVSIAKISCYTKFGFMPEALGEAIALNPRYGS